MLELREIQKTYIARGAEVIALGGVSLKIQRGTVQALQGPSGCGKTTLLLTAGGLLSPTAGEALFDGRDLYALTPEERAELRAAKIGFVFQQFHLIPYLSVLDNLRAAALALGGQPSEVSRARAEELIEEFGLRERSRHLPDELSTGERQRTALARALMNRPNLILADEPTGNLDAENAAIVLDALLRFANDGGAVLMASHDPRIAEGAQRVWRMREGKLESDLAG